MKKLEVKPEFSEKLEVKHEFPEKPEVKPELLIFFSKVTFPQVSIRFLTNLS